MSFCRCLERLRKAMMVRRILHRRGDVICTLVLLLLLCLLLYTQQALLSSGWSKPQLKLEIHSSTSSSRILLGARGARGCKGDQEPSQVTSELRLPPCKTQTIPEISQPQSRPQTRSPQTQSRSGKKKKAAGTKTTRNVPPAPTVPPFDFEGYLREKDNRNFKLLIDQPKKCDFIGEEDGGGSRSEAPYLLIAVKSIAADFDKRQVRTSAEGSPSSRSWRRFSSRLGGFICSKMSGAFGDQNCPRGLVVFLDQLQVRLEPLTLTVEARQDLCLGDVWLSCMKVVRQTWGKEGPFQPGVSIRTLFLLGIPRNRSSLPLWERLLAYESRTFRDILVWDFEDTFFNLTLKETHFLDWVNSSCPHVKFIFKGDADVYVNVENILEMLLDRDPEEDLFVGDIIVHAKPIRRRSSKYFVPEFLYGGGLYPNYAGGGGFVMSGRTARKLSSACQQVELFPIDDVFLGMCLQLIGVKASRHQGFRTFGIPRPSAAPHLQTFDPCFYKELMVVHSLSVPQIWLMWNLLHDQKLSCHNQTSLRSRPFKWRGKGRMGDVTEYGEKKVFITLRDQLED